MKEFTIGLVLRAGNILMRDWYKHAPQGIRLKSKREIVTKYDLEVNHFLINKIRQNYPDHAILSEEGKIAKSDSPYLWVIDPLDGTTNYSIHNPFFTTSVAVLKEGEPILGIVYAPVSHELYVAEKGRGAYCNEMKIGVSQETSLKNSFLTFGYAHHKESLARAMKVYQHFEMYCRSIRHLGCSSLELAYVASNRIEAEIITPPVRLWDIAAGLLLIEEAGGKVTDFKGERHNIAFNGLVASNGKIHTQILQLIKKKKI